MDLLAYLTALTVNAMGDTADAAALAKAVGLDMVKHWTPSVAGFFGRLPKAVLRDAVTEAKVKVVDFAGAKKLEAATLSRNRLESSGWLPKPLRFPL